MGSSQMIGVVARRGAGGVMGAWHENGVIDGATEDNPDNKSQVNPGRRI